MNRLVNLVYENWPDELVNNQWSGWQNELEMPTNNMTKYYNMIQWITENINDANESVAWTWSRGPVFRFRNAKDQSWFILRWS